MDEVWSVPGYDVETLLGSGAAGEVWRAREVPTGDVVVLRRLAPGTDPVALEALAGQVRLQRQVDTPYVVRLRAVVGDVLVLDHAPGGSLARLLSRRGVLQPGEVVTVAAPLAAALASLHASGTVHGEVTAANVRFTVEGMPLLADVGVAGALRVGPVRGGSPWVPDGAGAGDLDASADVRALAALCHRMLCGSPSDDPTARDDELEGAGSGQQAPLRPLESSVPRALVESSVPRALVEAVEAGLTATAADGPAAAAFGALLRRAHPTAPVRLTGGVRAGAGAGGSEVAGPGVAQSGVAGSGVSARPVGAWAPAGVADSTAVTPPGRSLAALTRVAGTRAGRSWTDRGRSGRAGEHRLSGRTSGGHAGPSGMRRRLPSHAGPAAALVAAVLVAAGVGWTSGRGDIAGAAVVVPVAAPVVASVPSSAPASDPAHAVPSDWTGLLDQLDAARAEAFARADPAGLRQVWSPGSAGLAADAAAIRQLAAAGQRASGLRHGLRGVQVARASATTAQLRVVDVLAAHEVLRRDGTVVRRVAERGSATWTLRLVRGDAGWRLASVAAA